MKMALTAAFVLACTAPSLAAASNKGPTTQLSSRTGYVVVCSLQGEDRILSHVYFSLSHLYGDMAAYRPVCSGMGGKISIRSV